MKVNLWFARDSFGKIIEINNADKNNYYQCPICNNEVIPKALNSKEVSAHFAHVDNSNCSHESMLHFWIKHLFIQEGEEFEILTDEKLKFKCKSFEVEKTFKLNDGIYKPDLVVYTECGNEIIFEIAKTNKKRVQNYVNKWIELDKIIVEVDILSIINGNYELNVLYHRNNNLKYYNEGADKVKKYLFKNNNQLNNYTLYKIDYLCELLNNISKDYSYKTLSEIIKISNDSSFNAIMNDIIKLKCNDYYVEKINEKLKLNIKEIMNYTEYDYNIEFEISKKRPYFITNIIIKINKNENVYEMSNSIFNFDKKRFNIMNLEYSNSELLNMIDKRIATQDKFSLISNTFNENIKLINERLKTGYKLDKSTNGRYLLLFKNRNNTPIEFIKIGAKTKKNISELEKKLINYLKEDSL